MGVLAEDLEKFLQPETSLGFGIGEGGNAFGYSGAGHGFGDAPGSGFMSGYCGPTTVVRTNESFDNGYGDGSGRGTGRGESNGNFLVPGRGDGSSRFGAKCIKQIDGMDINYIDCIPTIIANIKEQIASGYTVGMYNKLIPCFVAKVGGYFGHGNTTHSAYKAAKEKHDKNRPLSERISEFIKEFPSLQTRATVEKFYSWHHTLTGSCALGRNQFCEHNNIRLNEIHTVEWFLKITEDSYGGDVIKEVRQKYESITVESKNPEKPKITNKEKISKVVNSPRNIFLPRGEFARRCCTEVAEWKDQQAKEERERIIKEACEFLRSELEISNDLYKDQGVETPMWDIEREIEQLKANIENGSI